MSAAEKIKERLKGDKRLAVIVCAGIAGILLLMLSELVPHSEEKKAEEPAETGLAEYEQSIEERLSELISSIDGAGRTRVMITLDSGDENVYATKDKSSEKSYEKEYVVIKNDGDEDGMLLKVIEPEIRGVAVVCEGADSASVKQEIINTVTAVLGVGTSRVNIAKMKNTDGG